MPRANNDDLKPDEPQVEENGHSGPQTVRSNPDEDDDAVQMGETER